MIRALDDLRQDINTKIKVIPNNFPNKTQAADVKQLLNNMLDTVEDLVNQLGLLLGPQITAVDNKVVTDYTKLSNLPTLFNGNYNSLTSKPDLSKFRLTTDAISYTDLSNKPTLITSYTQLSDKPTIPAAFSKEYSELLNKPDLSLYRKNTDVIDYTTLSNRPSIISDYTQLSNKPSMSKLLWNQTIGFSYLNSTVETNVLIPGNGNGVLAIDANPVIGTTFRLTGRGLFTTQTINLGSNLAIKLYLGSTLIATGSINNFLLGAINKPLSFNIDMLITGTNSIYVQGSMSYFATTLDSLSAAPILNGTGSNAIVDFSTNNLLKMTLTWNTANNANVIQTKIVNLEKLNN